MTDTNQRPKIPRNVVLLVILAILLYMVIGFVTGNLHPWGPTVYIHP